MLILPRPPLRARGGKLLEVTPTNAPQPPWMSPSLDIDPSIFHLVPKWGKCQKIDTFSFLPRPLGAPRARGPPKITIRGT